MARKSKTRFNELKELFKTLHGPKGCLWDKKQTHKSLIPYLKEETAEFIAALRSNKPQCIKEELGDILLQVMFHSQIASKEGWFDIEDVVASLISKLKRRHPHVFSGVKVKSTHQIIRNWNKIKILEKSGRF
ncbi:MAG: hypothetical protein C4533_00950 [Candidatus Omnitrophota bacterium]|jgi:tetrapyrrole methylase family protein/MazG family protein|nr:MAG: hypothetical protein C4533_00950 [Candidatus Omnitrophota bacterium]